MKKKLYFVQTGCVFNNEHFLPYASGIIAAYAFSKEIIKANYELSDIIYKCDDFEETLNGIKEPDVVAFSCYMWNYSFNLKMAESVKAIYPECVIIFGGHQINDTEKCLEENSFIDFAVFGEGEKTVTDILISLCENRELSSVPGISYRSDKIITTAKGNSIVDINEIPSPYLNGIFDKILKNNDDKFAAVIETSRGCPYHCAYCDWGDYNLPLRHFDVDRVRQEIEYLGKNSVVFVVIADSNFGISEKDELIADEFVTAKQIYGYPKAIEVAFAKYSPERVFSINKKFYENNMSRGATLSMQTLDPETLKNIGRENMTKERFSELLRLYAENNIPSYTELILGLPGETYESFCEGIEFLLDNGQHNSIHVFYCEILPNALMGTKNYIEKHGIKSLEREFVLRNGVNSPGICGKSNIITETETLSKEMFLKSIKYSFIIQVMHNFGLCRLIALFFHYEKNITYFDFYNKLIDWLISGNQNAIRKIYEEFFCRYDKSIDGSCFEVYESPDLGKTQFNLSDGAFIETVRQCDEFYELLKEFVYSLYDNSEVVEEMIRFQKMIIRKPVNVQEHEEFSYDWVKYYFEAVKNKKAVLLKKDIRFTVLPSREYDDLLSYAQEIAIKGRRTGKSIVLNDADSYLIEYVDKRV